VRVEARYAKRNHHEEGIMTDVQTKIEPRERCPKCDALLMHESTDPLEEYCIDGPCDYYRAEIGDGEVIRE
jgi:hypothetical protein